MDIAFTSVRRVNENLEPNVLINDSLIVIPKVRNHNAWDYCPDELPEWLCMCARWQKAVLKYCYDSWESDCVWTFMLPCSLNTADNNCKNTYCNSFFPKCRTALPSTPYILLMQMFACYHYVRVISPPPLLLISNCKCLVFLPYCRRSF